MKNIYIILIFLFAINTAKGQAVDTTLYSYVTAGAIYGEQKAWQTGENEYHYRFYYNDRGRGSDQTSVVKLNPDGTIAKLNTSGIEYFKNPYNESFDVVKDSASWTVNGVTTKAKQAPKFYYSNSDIPAIDELEIKWLLKKPGYKGETFPAGSLRVTLGDLKKITLNGKTASVRIVSFYRNNTPTPYFIWIDSEGHFFAKGYGWSSIVKKGYESWADTLNNLEVKQQTPFYEAQMLKYSSNIPAQLMITHVNIFQSETADVKKDMSVEITNGRIKAIYKAAATPANFKGKLIDAKGKFLMPGLWDMHSHYFVSDGIWYLAGGVSHVRDMGNSNVVLTYQKQIKANQLLGPDISYLSGFIDQKGYYAGPTGTLVSSLGEALTAVRNYHGLGFQQIKLYSSIDTGWVRPMVQEAHKLGMRACGHVPSFMSAEQAIDDGYDELIHINFVYLNFMDHNMDTRTPLRFRKFAADGGSIDLNSAAVTAFIDKMKAKHISIDPTLNVFAEDINDFKGDTIGSMKPVAAWVPEVEKVNLTVNSPFGTDEQKPAYRKTFWSMLAMTKLMYDKGIMIVPGTDGGQAFALHHELELYVQAGIPAAQALKMATYNCAKDCNMLSTAGQIEPGMDADFILIDGDPMKNISDIRRVEWVIKNNRQYKPKKLLASQGWGYYY